MASFQKGDIVNLKSGGPKMSVVETGDYSPMGPADGVKCTWFDDKKKLSTEVFEAATLEHWEPMDLSAFTV